MKLMHLKPDEIVFLLQTRVPSELWVVLSAIICIGLVCIFSLVKVKEKKWQYSSVLCLTIYVSIMLCNTVIFRTEGNMSRVVLIPFWSYMEAVKESRSFYLIENLLNIVLFVPVGLFLKMSFRNMRFIPIVFCGLLLSLVIETSQLLLQRGWFEVDDMMHNTLGTVLGYLTIRNCKKHEDR